MFFCITMIPEYGQWKPVFNGDMVAKATPSALGSNSCCLVHTAQLL